LEILAGVGMRGRDAGGQSAGLGGQPLDHAFKSENKLVSRWLSD
jgi:hypothetical protein